MIDLHLLWIFMCSFRLLFWLKRLPQISQQNGFSPVWILLCLSRCPARSKHLPQYGQMKPFLNISLFTVLLRTVLCKVRYWSKPSKLWPNFPCWKPSEPMEGAPSLGSRGHSGRHIVEFCTKLAKLKKSGLLISGWFCVILQSMFDGWYKVGRSDWIVASLFAPFKVSHLTCTSGRDGLFWSSSVFTSGNACSSGASVPLPVKMESYW